MKNVEEDHPEYLYVVPQRHIGRFSDRRLATFTERHKIELQKPRLSACSDPMGAVRERGHTGVVVEMRDGWPSLAAYRLARAAYRSRKRVWFYWPRELAVECMDQERLGSYRRHWGVVRLALWARKVLGILRRVGNAPARVARSAASPRTAPPFRYPQFPVRPVAFGRAVSSGLRKVLGILRRVGNAPARVARSAASSRIAPPFRYPQFPVRPVAFGRAVSSGLVSGTGIYLRTDYWARISSGGSYGHTCYLAKALRKVTDDLICVMPQRYTLLDDLGLRQVVIDPPSDSSSEECIAAASDYYYRALKVALQVVRPAFIYERLCIGNHAGARLSAELGIPYVVEYNGSEISMLKSFGGRSYKYEEYYLKCEHVAFQQATVISVVSTVVKEGVVGRGVDERKIVVNPNGGDIDAYAPLPETAKSSLRAEFGWRDDHTVIGFTGTFGGWHGVDTLAEAIPKICDLLPEARWLIIGDGSNRHLVDTAISRHDIGDRVFMAGRVPQREGARLLGACDIFVSPHNRHMVDSRFFGSPTKVFEYMSMAGGIVASDLEQIGEVLSPALRLPDLRDPDQTVDQQRAVLCTPGDVDAFVQSVVALARRPGMAQALGRNARRAVEKHYSWDQHVKRLLCKMGEVAV